MNILLLEDEKLAANRLQQLLGNYFPAADIAWQQSIEGAKHYFAAHPMPDLIISDIELLDGPVFHLYNSVTVTAPIIFVTAYDNFLLDAFQTNGIGYLLKPYTDDDLHAVLDKYQQLIAKPEPTGISPLVLEQLTAALNKKPSSFKERFTIKKGGGIVFIKTVDIKFFRADGDLVFAIDKDKKKHLLNYRMSALEDVLDDKKFFRINRGEIINIEYVGKVEPYFGNRLALSVLQEKEVLISSGPKTVQFRKWLEQL